MSKRGSVRSEKRVSVRQDMTTYFNAGSATSYQTNPPSTTVGNIINNIKTEHNRSATIKTVMVDGYRSPTPYRVWALQVTPEQFSYHWKQYQYPAWYRVERNGLTDVKGGIGAPFYGYLGTKLSGGLRVPDVPSNMQNRTIAEAKNKLANADFNVLTSLAEAKEAFKFAAQTLVAISQLMRKLLSSDRFHKTFADMSLPYVYLTDDWKPIRVHKASGLNVVVPPGSAIKTTQKVMYETRRAMKSKHGYVDGYVQRAEEAWLGAMYAMQPMVMDFYNFVTIAEESLAKAGAHVKVVRSVKRKVDFPSRPGYATLWRFTGDCHVGCEIQLQYRMTNPLQHRYMELGLYNPFALFWEVTPYSFVVDWMLPIGNWLGSLTADVGMSYIDGYMNHKTVSGFSVENCYDPLTQGGGKYPSVRYDAVCQFRTVLNTSPVAGIYVKSPFGSVKNAISAIALTAQQLRR